MRQILDTVRSNPVFGRALTATLIAEAILVLLTFVPLVEKTSKAGAPTRGPLLEFDAKVGLALFTGVPLFLITILQLHHSSVVDRANFVREMAVGLRTNEELSKTFYYLVYNYTDTKFEEFKNADAPAREILQKGRPEGYHLFDPDLFQGSEEERHLDSLLGYLDVVGYHHYRKIVHIRDIAGALGWQLAYVASRKVVSAYLTPIPKHWKESSMTRETESVAPFRYLSLMLEELETWNKSHKEKIKNLNESWNKSLEEKIKNLNKSTI